MFLLSVKDGKLLDYKTLLNNMWSKTLLLAK